MASQTPSHLTVFVVKYPHLHFHVDNLADGEVVEAGGSEIFHVKSPAVRSHGVGNELPVVLENPLDTS